MIELGSRAGLAWRSAEPGPSFQHGQRRRHDSDDLVCCHSCWGGCL